MKAAGACGRYLGVDSAQRIPLPQAEEDQVRWQRADLLPVRCVQITVHLAADEGQGGVKQTVSTSTPHAPKIHKKSESLSFSYVQELEARLQHMESLFQQVAPILEQVGQATGIDASSLASAPGAPGAPNVAPSLLQALLNNNSNNRDNSGESTRSSSPTQVKIEDDVSASFGQLALDEHGQMRFLGSSSAMQLIHAFQNLTTSPLHRLSPAEEDPRAPGPSVNKLYFPASVFFGKVRVLPGPEEVEWPDRDLADKLVSAIGKLFG